MNYRLLWEQAHGPIPDGHVIHHINGDRSDNRIENLRCMTASEHASFHRCLEYLRQLPPKAAFTGAHLDSAMQRARMTPAKMAQITGVTRAYICQLLGTPDEAIPNSTVTKLRAGFLKYHRDVAAVYFDLTGEFCEGMQA